MLRPEPATSDMTYSSRGDSETVIDSKSALRTIALTALAFTAIYALIAAPVVFASEMSGVVRAASALLGIALAALSAIDLKTFRLPDKLTLPLAAAGLSLTAILDWESLVWHIAAAAAGYLVLRAVAEIYQRTRGRPGLGQGDAKLLAASGAWIGLEGLPSIVLIASATALLCVAAALAAGKQIESGQRIPFGPFLAFGTWLVWLYGPVF